MVLNPFHLLLIVWVPERHSLLHQALVRRKMHGSDNHHDWKKETGTDVVLWIKQPPAIPPSHINNNWRPKTFYFWFCSLLMHPTKQWKMVQVLSSLHSHGFPGWSSWFLVSAWSSPSCCSCLGSEPAACLLAHSLSSALLCHYDFIFLNNIH